MGSMGFHRMCLVKRKRCFLWLNSISNVQNHRRKDESFLFLFVFCLEQTFFVVCLLNCDTAKLVTPWKINVERENDPIEKEHFWVPCQISGVYIDCLHFKLTFFFVCTIFTLCLVA